MNSTKTSSTPQNSNQPSNAGEQRAGTAKTSKPLAEVSRIRTVAREFVNPVEYEHLYDSMARFANFLALRYDANRTRHAYYRQVRLIHDHFKCDPVEVTEEQLRE